VAEQAGRSSDLKLELDSAAASISEEYLGKLAEELTQNALKFSKAGSPVSIALSGSTTGVTLTFNDRGRGFTADQISRIGAYMQFDRRSQEQQGVGLGLVIAKRIAEMHGGSLGISSDPENGTTVTVKFLPAA